MQRRRVRTPKLLAPLATSAALLILGACASAGEPGGGSHSRDVLTIEEIRDAGPRIQTAWDALEQLRPHWLRERANPTMGVPSRRADPVVVYVNGARRGGAGELRRIRVEQLVRIRFVRPTDAQTRYGLGHGSGALEVTVRAAIG